MRIDIVTALPKLIESPFNDSILKRAQEKNIDAVIWTDLAVKFFNKINKPFNTNNVIKYLENLPKKQLELAKEYILKTPPQIHTRLREKLI